MTFPSRTVPARIVGISLASLAVPLVTALAAPDWLAEEEGLLIWLWAFAPAFLFAYYRGLRGVALALAAGMATLSLAHVELILLESTPPNWNLLFAAVSAYLAACVGAGIVAEMLHRERAKAERLALVDQLTGLPNRRHAELTLDAQFAAAGRGQKLAVVLFDLDLFKQINDRHGHKAGDAVLRIFGQILRRNTRRMDLSARFGGEEFITVLSDCDPGGAELFAQRVQRELREARFGWGSVTVSAGIAFYEEGMGSYEVLVAAADRALYAAKHAGRDRIEVYRPPKVAAVAQGARPASERGEPRRSASIVVIDDDLDVLRAVTRLLQRAGYRVEGTDDPQRVIALYRDGQTRPDLLITDVMMPRMNGLTLVDSVLRLDPGVRVVYLSGYLQEEARWAGLPGAASAFVGKPVEAERLIAAVREMLERKPEDDSSASAGRNAQVPEPK
ncbi:putative diguanylate cyclase YegE [bacterium HR33]|nr:putative diguanylate cyclase YegE [bacterium HR33]